LDPRDVDERGRPDSRRHHKDLGRDDLEAESKLVRGRGIGPQARRFFARAVEQRLARADGRAHRLLADARPVVAHVALHHDLAVGVDLGHAERTRHRAIAARDATRLPRRLHHPVAGAFDRVSRTYLRARRLLAVHADDRHGLHTFGTVDVLEVNHRLTAVRVALAACLHTGLAADAAARIDEEVQVAGLWHCYCWGSNVVAYSGGPSALRTRQPHTLY
jgi:hypothetical protein